MLDIGAKLEEIYQKGWLLVDKKRQSRSSDHVY